VTNLERVTAEQDARVEAGMCADGCGKQLPPLRHDRLRYLDGNHRDRGYAQRFDARMADQGLRTRGRRIAISASGVSNPTTLRRTDAESGVPAGQATRPRRRRTELRVPYGRAVDHMANWLEAAGEQPATARRYAEQVMRRALTPRQRKALETSA
jgi:hypothetical protein